MRVVVTGGHGFLGRRVVAAVAERGLVASGGERVVPTDIVQVDVVEAAPLDVPGARSVAADLAEPGAFVDLLDHDDDVSVFHLASMVSAECELDWSRAVHNNVGAMVELIEAARRRTGPTRVVFASSVAVFGGDVIAGPVGDRTRLLPATTYGMTKAVGELLLDDATRTGALDGRAARLPTVVVRPGRPNRAASGFFSGLFREPLAGRPTVVPVPDDVGVIVIGPATATAGLLALHDLPADALGADRAVGLPGLEVTVGEMLEVLRRVGGDAAIALVERRPDADVERIVRGWATRWDDAPGRALGLPADTTLEAVVREHVRDVASSVGAPTPRIG